MQNNTNNNNKIYALLYAEYHLTISSSMSAGSTAESPEAHRSGDSRSGPEAERQTGEYDLV